MVVGVTSSRSTSHLPRKPNYNMIDDKEISLTSTAAIVAMTKALPYDNDGARPVVYDQVIDGGASDGESGSPDPAHMD